MKRKTAGIWLLLPFVARFLLNSVLVSYFELYKYDRADIHYVSPLLVIPVVKTLRNFCTGWWVTAGPPKCLSVLCHRSGLSQDHQASPQLRQLLMPNACAPGALASAPELGPAVSDTCCPSINTFKKSPKLIWNTEAMGSVKLVNSEFCHYFWTPWTWVNCLNCFVSSFPLENRNDNKTWAYRGWC